MSAPVQPPLRVETVDGTTSGRPITTIKVTNGDLSISGSTATIDTSGSGGGGTITSITFSSPLTGGTITTTGTVGIPEADGTTDGYLSSTAYNTFDGKQDAITLTTTGSSGVATFTAGTLNIPNYTNTATIGGSIANSQVAYGSGANTIQGSANLTFDGTNLDVAGYVKSGTGVYDTNGATDLTLQTNSGTNTGKIVIFDGADQDIEITPEGAGVINLDGLKWPSADGSANQVLQTDGAGTLSFTDGGGSGTVTSITAGTGLSGGTITTSGTIDLTFPIEAPNGSFSAPSYSFSTDSDLGMFRYTDFGNAVLSFTNGGSRRLNLRHDGTIQFNDAYTFPASDGSANQVLQTDGAGTLSFATVSGAGGIGGSITEGQIAFGSSTADEIEGTSNFTFDSTNNILTGASTWKIDTAGAGGGSIRIQNGGSEVSRFGSGGFQAPDGTSSIPSIAFLNSYQTGFYRAAANEIGVLNNASESFRFGASGELLISGTDAGTSGQVFTSGGASASPTWSDASGGNDFNVELCGTELDATGSSYANFDVMAMPPYGVARFTTANIDTKQYFFPFIAPFTGNLSAMSYNITSAAGSATNLYMAIYEDNNGVPSDVLGYATIDATVDGSQTTTSFSSTISLTRGTQYYIAYNKSTTESITIRSIDNAYCPRITPSSGFPSTTNGYSTSFATNGNVSSAPANTTADDLEPGVYFSSLGGRPQIGLK